MDNFDRLKQRTGEKSDALLEDLLETAKSAIFTRRFPYSEWPEELEPRYRDLQFRIALALYNKEGGEFEKAHTENGITRTWASEDIPLSLLSEVTPKVGGIG